MNLMTFCKEIGERFRGLFVFYKGEDNCPFTKNNPLSVMWIAERNLLYSDKVYKEWIEGNLVKLRDDDVFVKSVRDKYLLCQIGLMVSKRPFLTGNEVVDEFINQSCLEAYKEELRRLSDLARNDE